MSGLGVPTADIGARDPDREPETRPYAVRLGHAFAELIEHLPVDERRKQAESRQR
jgi:hypothetical protein